MTGCHSSLPARSDDLRKAVRGHVWLPGDPGFDETRRPWNLSVDQPVSAVVEAVDAGDVAALVRFATETGCGISTQPNGHGATGNTAGTILLRTGRLNWIEIDPKSNRAKIGAGVRSGNLQHAAAEHGLTGLPGSSPVVSVAGAVLGGGLSWFGRAFGWIADSVTAFDVVDAGGELHNVRAMTDPDLFWALRGGGGNYSIVTGMELTLHDAPSVYGGRILWDGTHARAVAAAFRTMTGHAPRELTLWLEILHFPSGEQMVAIDSTFLGTPTDAHKYMTEIDALPQPMSDTRGIMSVGDLGGITAEPTDPGLGRSRGELLTRLDDAALSALVDEPISPLMAIQVRHLEGALALPSDSPHGALTEPYAVHLFGLPSDPSIADAIQVKQVDLADRLPTSGRKPVTFLHPGERLSDALSAETINRLRHIKWERDPSRVFRGNFGVDD